MMRFNQFLHGLSKEVIATKCHIDSLDLPCGDLMLWPPIKVGDAAGTSRQLLGDTGHFLFGNVTVVTVECLTRDCLSVGQQKEFDGLGHVGSMHLLTTPRRSDRLAPNHLTHQVKPTARVGRVSQAINTGWT